MIPTKIAHFLLKTDTFDSSTVIIYIERLCAGACVCVCVYVKSVKSFCKCVFVQLVVTTDLLVQDDSNTLCSKSVRTIINILQL